MAENPIRRTTGKGGKEHKEFLDKKRVNHSSGGIVLKGKKVGCQIK